MDVESEENESSGNEQAIENQPLFEISRFYMYFGTNARRETAKWFADNHIMTVGDLASDWKMLQEISFSIPINESWQK